MEKRESRLLRFTRLYLDLARRWVPDYRSRFSKHTFTQPQHIVLNSLRIRLGLPYREFVDMLEEMPRIREVLGLKEIPHYTTLQKAFNRLSLVVWRILLRASTSLLPGSRISAIDASGFDRHYASRYYTQRARLKISSIKTTLLVDVGNQMIQDVHLTTTRKHDTQIAPQLVNRCSGKIEVLIGDKGYDDQNFRQRLKEQGIRPLIRHREFKPQDKAASARMDAKLYPRTKPR